MKLLAISATISISDTLLEVGITSGIMWRTVLWTYWTSIEVSFATRFTWWKLIILSWDHVTSVITCCINIFLVTWSHLIYLQPLEPNVKISFQGFLWFIWHKVDKGRIVLQREASILHWSDNKVLQYSFRTLLNGLENCVTCCILYFLLLLGVYLQFVSNW